MEDLPRSTDRVVTVARSIRFRMLARASPNGSECVSAISGSLTHNTGLEVIVQ